MADTPLSTIAAKGLRLEQIVQAVEQHQAKMARLRALEASNAVSHCVPPLAEWLIMTAFF